MGSGRSRRFSCLTYPLSWIVDTMDEYVDGLPMPSSTILLTSEGFGVARGGFREMLLRFSFLQGKRITFFELREFRIIGSSPGL